MQKTATQRKKRTSALKVVKSEPELIHAPDHGVIDDTEDYEKADPVSREHMEEARKATLRLKKAMSAPGALKLPPLLEKRRLAYGITDGHFKCALVGDRVWVKQITEWQHGKFGDTSIVMPDNSAEHEKMQTPLGILLRAGPKALDELRSNGIDLGHRVRILKYAPWSMRVDTIDGHEERVLVMHAGDIQGSEDLQYQLDAGVVRIEQIEVKDGESTKIQHVFVDQNGKTWNPQQPWVPDDM